MADGNEEFMERKLRELRESRRDNYIQTEVVCPSCGKAFVKQLASFCPSCFVTIFERDENGRTRLIEPTEAEKRLSFAVKLPAGGTEDHRAGEVVCLETPKMADYTVIYYMDGEELSEPSFLMPAHDVEITVRTMSTMSRGGFPEGGMGMMNMSMNGIPNDNK